MSKTQCTSVRSHVPPSVGFSVDQSSIQSVDNLPGAQIGMLDHSQTNRNKNQTN